MDIKDILEKFTLIELFAYLAPGAIVLFSITLWVRPNIETILGKSIAEQQIIVGFLLFILSYALGFIIAWWSNSGVAYYFSPDIHRNLFQWRPAWWLLCLFYAQPLPRINQGVIAQQVEIIGHLEQSGVDSLLSVLNTPWELLATFRTLMMDKFAEQDLHILHEVDRVHSRLLFALGVHLAVLLVALQALIRLVFQVLVYVGWVRSPMTLWDEQLPYMGFPMLFMIGLLGFMASFGLRRAAGKWLEYEMLLTFSLAQRLPTNDSQLPSTEA